MPQVASEAHAASHASARSSQRNRPADNRSDAPPTPFAALIDRAAGDSDLTARAGQPADAVTPPETSRNAERPRHDRHDAGRRNDRVESSGNDKPARQRHGAGKARGDADPADTKAAAQTAQGAGKDATQDTKITDDSDTATDGDDTTVTDDGKDSTDAAALLADALPATTTDTAPADAAKTVIAAAVATPTAPVAADTGDTATTGTDPVIGGGSSSTPALLAADLKAAAGDDTQTDGKADGKTDGKTDTAKSADATDGPDDATLRDALKAQHAGDARDGKPADAQAKPADGDAKPATEQKAHHAAGADKAADAAAPAPASSQTAQNQLPQTQLPQTQHAAQPSAAPANAAPQAPAVPIEGVAVQITAQAKAGKQSFEIRLDPPELGRIDVRLDVDRHGHVTSRLVVDRPETLDLLRRDAGGLERALQDAGLKTSDNGLQFSLRDQTMQQQAFRQSRDTAEVIVRDDALPPVETTQRGYRSLSGARGGVDISV